jgi:hypothetical protein
MSAGRASSCYSFIHRSHAEEKAKQAKLEAS